MSTTSHFIRLNSVLTIMATTVRIGVAAPEEAYWERKGTEYSIGYVTIEPGDFSMDRVERIATEIIPASGSDRLVQLYFLPPGTLT